MEKLKIALIIFVFLLPVAWYLLSPLFIVVEKDESSPLESLVIKDNMDSMDADTKKEFEQQVGEMGHLASLSSDSMPEDVRLQTRVGFVPAAHEVEGEALLIDTPNGKVLRFEDFKTVNGPELHIYLSSDLSDEDFVDLGIIKATKGNVNYDVPADVDVEKYNKVLVWCKPFGVLFSYAHFDEI